uniref:Uncharacterized protein n=1 Tax=Panagrolaimus superbus TaxID=310955 RepID=A0A914YXQ8_9BILA
MNTTLTDWENPLDDNKNNNNPSVSLSLQQIANSTSQILGCLMTNPAFQNKSDSVIKQQRPKPYEAASTSKSRRNELQVQNKPTGIILEYTDLMVLNEAVSKLNEVVTRLNEAYEIQTSTTSQPDDLFIPTSSPTPTINDEEDGIQILEGTITTSAATAADISNHLNDFFQDNNAETQLDPLLNVTNGLSSCLKPCLIVLKDDEHVYEYTIQKKRIGNEYYCCSSCRKLPSPRSNLVIYGDGKITCSLHNIECMPISKEESLRRQEKRQIRFAKSCNNNITNNNVEE